MIMQAMRYRYHPTGTQLHMVQPGMMIMEVVREVFLCTILMGVIGSSKAATWMVRQPATYLVTRCHCRTMARRSR